MLDTLLALRCTNVNVGIIGINILYTYEIVELGAWYCKEIVFDGKGQNPVFTDCQDAVYREILARSIINTHQTCIDD